MIDRTGVEAPGVDQEAATRWPEYEHLGGSTIHRTADKDRSHPSTAEVNPVRGSTVMLRGNATLWRKGQDAPTRGINKGRRAHC
ncbi:MAG: hypothetical protein R2839_03610 [Thermomicrobiales bacterium]